MGLAGGLRTQGFFVPNVALTHGHRRQVKMRKFEFLEFVEKLDSIFTPNQAAEPTLDEPREVADFIQALGIFANEFEFISVD